MYEYLCRYHGPVELGRAADTSFRTKKGRMAAEKDDPVNSKEKGFNRRDVFLSYTWAGKRQENVSSSTK